MKRAYVCAAELSFECWFYSTVLFLNLHSCPNSECIISYKNISRYLFQILQKQKSGIPSSIILGWKFPGELGQLSMEHDLNLSMFHPWMCIYSRRSQTRSHFFKMTTTVEMAALQMSQGSILVLISESLLEWFARIHTIKVFRLPWQLWVPQWKMHRVASKKSSTRQSL